MKPGREGRSLKADVAKIASAIKAEKQYENGSHLRPVSISIIYGSHVDTHAQMYTRSCTHECTAHIQAHTLGSQPLHTRAHSPSHTLSGGFPLHHARALLVPLSQLGGTFGGRPKPSPRPGCAEGHSGPGQRQLLRKLMAPVQEGCFSQSRPL